MATTAQDEEETGWSKPVPWPVPAGSTKSEEDLRNDAAEAFSAAYVGETGHWRDFRPLEVETYCRRLDVDYFALVRAHMDSRMSYTDLTPSG